MAGQFNFRKWLMDGFRQAVQTRSMPTDRIILSSAGWMEKGHLKEEDLEELDRLIKERDGG